jgi:hypothetical protein
MKIELVWPVLSGCQTFVNAAPPNSLLTRAYANSAPPLSVFVQIVCFNAFIAVIKPEKRTVRLTLKFRFLEQPDPRNPRRSRMDAFVCVVPIHAAQRINLLAQLARLL